MSNKEIDIILNSKIQDLRQKIENDDILEETKELAKLGVAFDEQQVVTFKSKVNLIINESMTDISNNIEKIKENLDEEEKFILSNIDDNYFNNSKYNQYDYDDELFEDEEEKCLLNNIQHFSIGYKNR
jgi:hypothetical protein